MAYQNIKKMMKECGNPAVYNFELECDYEEYAALPSIERFLTYKAKAVGEEILGNIGKGRPDERKAEGCYHESAVFCVDRCRKYPNLTDCDGWDGKCSLAVDLYETLWGWKEGEQRRGSSLFRTVKPFGALGGDTLNSVQTTLNEYLKALNEEKEIYRQHLKNNTSTRFCLQLYCLYGKDFIKQLAEKEELVRLIQLTHTMGNLGLVPAGYNGARGSAKKIQDYSDLSLYNLLHNCDGMSGKYFGEDEETRKHNFARYINFSFLWDSVEKRSNTYEVRPLCDSHEMKMHVWDLMGTWTSENVLPKKEELEQLCRNINSRIIRRGLFMEAMLKIAVGFPQVYKKLAQEIFLTEQIYDGYGEVIEAVRETLRHSAADEIREVSAIMDDLEEGLENHAWIVTAQVFGKGGGCNALCDR